MTAKWSRIKRSKEVFSTSNSLSSRHRTSFSPISGKAALAICVKKKLTAFCGVEKAKWLGQNIHDNFYENLYGGVHVHAYGNVCWNFKVVSFPDLLENLLTTAAAAGELVNTGWFFNVFMSLCLCVYVSVSVCVCLSVCLCVCVQAVCVLRGEVIIWI